MKGKDWLRFRIISMLPVITALVCAFALTGLSEQRFWTMLGTASSALLLYLLLYRRAEKEKRSNEEEQNIRIEELVSKIQSMRSFSLDLDKIPVPSVKVNRSTNEMLRANTAFRERIYEGELSERTFDSILNTNDLEKLLSDKKNVVDAIRDITISCPWDLMTMTAMK